MAINPLASNAIQQALFKQADSNKSGKVSVGEFAKALEKASGNTPLPAEAVKALNYLDVDASGDLNLDEFAAANLYASVSAQQSGPNLYQALQSAGIASANVGSNIYSGLIGGSLSGNLNGTGALVGAIVGGSLVNKLS
ncbi:MAG: EF-hand domain-containing protein [Pseudomonadaceae bacterium]|nr:EF-hand domain-containing protein [Pseudomonadaceae bacterium]